jgi:hypothetical protein
MATRPNLDSWLDGAGAEHPVRVEMAFGGIDDLLDDLEQLLATLEEAAPSRLQGKRRDFRSLTDRERWFDLRSELLLAWWLSLQGVAYEFGSPGTSQPDFVLPDFGFGIEVTRRARDGSEALRMSLFRRLTGVRPRSRPVVTLSAQPLAIREGVLKQISDEAVAALTRGDHHLDAVVRPARDGHPATTAAIDLFRGDSEWPRVRYLESAALLAVTMLDVEDLILSCLEDKRKAKQGASMPCLLVIDASRLVDAVWLRPKDTWAKRLAHLLTDEHTFIGVALLYGRVGALPHLALGIGPQASADDLTAIARWSEQMGIEIVNDQ